jgi:hypothetical protein
LLDEQKELRAEHEKLLAKHEDLEDLEAALATLREALKTGLMLTSQCAPSLKSRMVIWEPYHSFRDCHRGPKERRKRYPASRMGARIHRRRHAQEIKGLPSFPHGYVITTWKAAEWPSRRAPHPPFPTAGSGHSASTRRRILNRFASMPGASVCLATRFSRSSTPSSSAMIRPRQLPLPEIVLAEPATMACHYQKTGRAARPRLNARRRR